MALEQRPFLVGENRGLEHHHALLAGFLVQNVRQIAEAGLEAHHPRFPKRIDRRVGHLAEVLAEEVADAARLVGRSEEHTSELQSLMRTSYAVFLLKKKKPKITQKD